MPPLLPTIQSPLIPTQATDRAARYAAQAASPNTARAYTADVEHYAAWCAQHGLTVLPSSPQQIGAYLADHAEVLSAATLTRRLAAIGAAHRSAGHQLDTRHPAIRDVMSGIRREHGVAQRQVAAATTPHIQAMIATCGDDLVGLRDRALLLIGFGGALRRSEIVTLEVRDLGFDREGVRITIRRSKTDQEGAGQTIGIGIPAAVEALLAWLAAAGIADGRVFRSLDRGQVGDSLSDRSVANIVKARASAAGLDAAEFSGHSLRSGFATTAAAAGVEERIIQRTTRHVDLTTLRRYIRTGTVWTENASSRLGL